ncbi:YbaB/EbfC family nucleoid-associated protein [Nocardia sp. XZ_19_385]|uniref:YbaB/EbfC family nucleoid-associated protein n=1 Tax=Nocardia sp. XZ_19_385 TaxID=2769488 RepID=UPI00188EAA49|nr:YbaB/EbfC family nucleoid-associated protein [Nocardia sp. XZ_19_385]
MSSSRRDAELSGMLEEFRARMRDIAEMQQQRVKLVATATTKDRQISVTVNANGVVIETKFGSGIDEYSYDDIAKAITRLAQQAAEDVFGQSQEVMAPLAAERARLPKLSDVIPGMPDVQSEIPLAPPVSVAPPGSAERAEDELVFTDVEIRNDGAESGKGVTDSVW